MDDLTLVKKELEAYNYPDLQQLEGETGVPAGTIAKIKGGQTPDPRYSTVRRLANYFRAKAAGAATV